MKFSQFYLKPQEYLTDSLKMRIRIGSYIHNLTSFYIPKINNFNLASQIKQNVGIGVPGYQSVGAGYIYNFEQLSLDISVAELLDVLTVAHDCLTVYRDKVELITFINTCFQEEGISYTMNDVGEVRFRPDQEFERNRIVTLKSMSGDGFSAALEAFNTAFTEFQTDIKKAKSALRYIFEANEILFKKLVKPDFECTRLTEKNISLAQDHILVEILGHQDITAKNATSKLLSSYKEWVNAMHPYRHGQDVESYDNPPNDLTILALSNGASYLRWIASLIQLKLENKK